MTQVLRTRRLDLVAATPAHLEAELADPAALGRALGARVPADWPPGEYDRDAMQFIRDRLNAGGEAAAGWFGWYAIARDASGGAVLVGAAGYFGPPGPDGTVEIGYSVAAESRGRGYATEIVQALVARALEQPGVVRVVAEARADNAASNHVLARCGFHPVGQGRNADSSRWQLAPPLGDERSPGAVRAAAVLVPLCRDANGTWRLVVVRRAEGGIHGGQLAFPGGAVAPGDASLQETALREAGEEIGLPAGIARIVAELPAVETRVSNFHITPFLALLSVTPAWRLDPREIAEVLEPALAELTASGARRFASDLLPAGWGPIPLPYYAVGPHRLWGASERILHALIERLRAGEWPEIGS